MTYKSKVGYSSTVGYSSSVGYKSSSGFNPISPEERPRQWTIGNSGDEYGFSSNLQIGDLVPRNWFDNIEDVLVLAVDDSSNAVILESSNNSQWNGQQTVVLAVEGSPDITLNWNGTFYVAIDVAFTAYIVSNLGNTLQMNVLPESLASWFDLEPWFDSNGWRD